jgi:Mrp family chromosome partitioning ATPase
MLGLDQAKVMQTTAGWTPVRFPEHGESESGSLVVMSIAFLLPNSDDSVVWRGPKKASMIKQFVESVNWGDLDFLLIDTPPGTSDEHMSILETLRQTPYTAAARTEAILVTTPQLISVQDVAKEITFCRQVGLSMAGLVENMSGYVCPHCETCCQVFSSGGGAALARQEGLCFLGSLPICPAVTRLFDGRLAAKADASEPYLLGSYGKTPLAPKFGALIDMLLCSSDE